MTDPYEALETFKKAVGDGVDTSSVTDAAREASLRAGMCQFRRMFNQFEEFARSARLIGEGVGALREKQGARRGTGDQGCR